MLRLIIFGPPGAGKGTYATRIAKILGIEKISTGDIFREEVSKRSELGRKVEEYLRRGVLVPDEIVIEVVRRKIEELHGRGFILDGYPRTIVQARALDEITTIDAIINLIVPDEIIIEKLAGRRICSECGAIYNIVDVKKVIDGVEYILPPIPPKKEGICDICGGRLIQRGDDRPEIIRRRLEVYRKQSEPVIKYYRDKGVKFINIHVNREPEVIINRILNALRREGLLD